MLKLLVFPVIASLLAAYLFAARSSSICLQESKQSYDAASNEVIRAAQLMKNADYAFRPASQSPSFRDLVQQSITMQIRSCAAIADHPMRTPEVNVGDKNGLLRELRRASEVCNSAYSSVGDANAYQMVQLDPSETASHSRLGLMFLTASRLNGLYGEMATYLALNGINLRLYSRIVPLSAPSGVHQ